MNTFANRNLLIIGGTSKAGTTSLYDWLSNHPEIGPSKIKETRFFLDSDYPLPRTKYDNSDFSNFANYFNTQDIERDCTLLETTPDYLYCRTPLKIPEYFPNCKMVFVLRNPTDRFISWFRYAKQRNFIAKNTTIESFLEMQSSDISESKPIHCYALHQGLYEDYLARYRSAFGENLLTIEFQELRDTPHETAVRICKFANISTDFFDNFNFTVSNKTKDLRFPIVNKVYADIRRNIAFFVMKHERLTAQLRKINAPIKKLLNKNVSNSTDKEQFTNYQLMKINEFYQNTNSD